MRKIESPILYWDSSSQNFKPSESDKQKFSQAEQDFLTFKTPANLAPEGAAMVEYAKLAKLQANKRQFAQIRLAKFQKAMRRNVIHERFVDRWARETAQ